jgi:hypothetical protein
VLDLLNSENMKMKGHISITNNNTPSVAVVAGKEVKNKMPLFQYIYQKGALRDL